jgi:hypothetical protein
MEKIQPGIARILGCAGDTPIITEWQLEKVV